ncbi:transposase [Limnospira indica PCC 8005]|uniref:Transposase n=1 Tax=Limnospira indica PCC 8005 TaxID=376219 RepID=A0A9P1NZG1_9CYAN|nr:transposase [Limnospira indica PCC 8005]
MWLEFILIPTLKPGQALVLDNATFHKGGRIAELVEAAQCRLLYLPQWEPASPSQGFLRRSPF